MKLGTALFTIGTLGLVFLLGRRETNPQLAAAAAQQRYYEEQQRKAGK